MIYIEGDTVYTSLDVSEDEATDENIKALALNSTLTHLNLEGAHINDAKAKTLALSSTITDLSLWRNNVTDEGAKALALNTTLRCLHLTHCEVGNGGAKAFGVNTTLVSLYIWLNKIDGEGAKALSLNTTLTRLDLDYNNISDEGAEALSLNTTLTSLNINSPYISDEWKGKIRHRIRMNKQEMFIRRDQFIRCLIVLARDATNCESNSTWRYFPGDMRRYIIDHACRHWNVGLSYKEARACATFISQNITQLSDAIRMGTPLKIVRNLTV